MPIRTTTKSATSVSTVQPLVTTQRPSLSTTNNPDKIQLSKYTVIRLRNLRLPKNVTLIFCKLFNLLKLGIQFHFIIVATYITFIYQFQYILFFHGPCSCD